MRHGKKIALVSLFFSLLSLSLFLFLSVLVISGYDKHVSSPTTSKGWDDDNIDLTKKRGDKIIELISTFRESNGRFPNTLDELERDTGEDTAPLVGSGVWKYEVDDSGRTFGLSVGDDPHQYPCLYYRDSGWMLDL